MHHALIWLSVAAACGSESEPPSCVDIKCTSAISGPSDVWVHCGEREAICVLPEHPPLVCRVTAADQRVCVCRFNADNTVTPLCSVPP